jgi:hypothetical protein
MWDYESWDAISARLVRCARDAGAFSALPFGLIHRAGVHLLAGEHTVAASVADEVTVLTEATGSSIAPYAALAVAAFKGNAEEATELIGVSKTAVIHRGEGAGLSLVYWATALLHNGLGCYQDALVAAQQANEETNASWWSNSTRLVTSVRPSTAIPAARAAMASSTVDISTTSAPRVR